MYAEFFGLRELPFNNTPDPRFFYSTPDHEEALASLIYAVQERKGFVLLTGEVGAGKTLLSRMMLRHFGARITSANIHHAVPQVSDLMESLCTEFELPVDPQASRPALVHALHDFLLAQFAKDTPVALVLDEAHTMPVEAFEQLRMIGNLEADDAKLLQIVILGQPELQRRFASPEFRQLRQRIFRTFHLPALDRRASGEYIRHRLAIASAPTLEIFDHSAIDRIFEHSQGLPRLINTICDNAMLSAYSADRHRIDGEFIESVITQMMTFEGVKAAIPDVDEPRPVCSEPPSPALLPGPAVGSDGHAYRSAYGMPPQNPVDELARRIGYLEGRLSSMQPLSSPTPAAPEPGEAGHPPERLIGDLSRIKEELAAKTDDANRRLVELEDRFRNTAGLLTAARSAQARLEPLIRNAEDVIPRTEHSFHELARHEVRVQQTAAKMSAVVTEMRSVFDGLRRAFASLNRAERRAQRVGDRLVAQAERSRDAVGEMKQRSPAVAPAETGGRPEPVLVKEASAAVNAVAAPGSVTSPARGEPDRFQQILERTRASLADLRTVVRQADPARTAARPVEPDRPAGSEPLSAEAPTARLAGQIESLLQMVQSREAGEPQVV